VGGRVFDRKRRATALSGNSSGAEICSSEAALMEHGQGMAGLSDRWLEAICLLGPVDRCRERQAAFRGAVLDLPILDPPRG
jgi:hypothetical protein